MKIDKFSDIVLDTVCFIVFLNQYFECKAKDRNENLLFYPEFSLESNVVHLINQILQRYLEGGGGNRVVVSAFAFVEIARKFSKLSDKRFRIEQFKAFIEQHPPWFVIAPVEKRLYTELVNIPAEVKMPGGDFKTIEWADAIHLATAMSRNSDKGIERCKLATTDARLKSLERTNAFQGMII
ncbi:MAG: PIN domain-containing protein [bacterium]|nr:PIN domain-containing protein [bacterium]